VDAVTAPKELGGDRAAKAAAGARDHRRPHARHHNPRRPWPGAAAELPLMGGPSGPRGERKPLEESPDTTGQGGG
jgi:hypothetical protein